MEFKFGDIVKHKTKEFKGIIIGKAKYYDECTLYGVFFKKKNDGIAGLDWIDEISLESTGNSTNLDSIGMQTVLPKIKNQYL